MKVDKNLTQFATVRQLEYIDAINQHGSHRKAAKALGVSNGTIGDSIVALKKKAALAGYSPEHHLTRPIAPGLKMRGTSQLYRRGEAEPVLEWIKTSANEEMRAAAQKAAFEALAEELPRLLPVGAPPSVSQRLATVYTLTDSHVGAMCWHREGGADWDLRIAEHTLVGCFEKMVAASPNSRIGIVAQLGDFLHQDGISAVTPLHGNLLDADGRFTKVVQVAVRVLRRVVDLALAKHEKVVVLMAEGNHDISSSIWLRTMFAALYENEPRIEVIDSPLPYYCLQHGKTMLAWHHGHLSKNDQLPILFASQFPAIWGATTKRYAHTGHRHHVEEKEHSGITVMQHTTLTARDAYAARGGWIADRAVTAVTYDDQFGKHSTVTICPEMLEDYRSSGS
jgi:hypothetical protein